MKYKAVESKCWKRSSTPISAIPPDRHRWTTGKATCPSGEKAGGQPGHVGKGRALFSQKEVTQSKDCYPAPRCACCGAVWPCQLSRRHQVIDLAAHAWLQKRSALGELIDFDFESMDLNRLYGASDALYKHRDALREHLFGAAKLLFGFNDTVTLYDLTNTYFDGIAAGVKKTARGRSKKKRSDCPLVTLAVVLDGSGFVRRIRVFAGNASEPQTLEDMLTDLAAPKEVTVAMDDGIATEANLAWLKAHDYHYVVVSRKRQRQFDPAMTSEVQTAGDVTIKIHRVLDADNGEANFFLLHRCDALPLESKVFRFQWPYQKLMEK